MGAREQRDDYEAQYMSSGTEILAREKLRLPKWMQALVALPFLIGLGLPFFAGAEAIPVALLIALIGLPLWLMTSVLRIVVSDEAFHIQYGISGPKIPIERINHISEEKYKMLKYGGIGIRLGVDGSMAYSAPGVGGRGVRVRYTNEKGKEKSVFVSSANPARLIAAVEKAQRGLLAGTTTEVLDTGSALDDAKVAQGLVERRDASEDEHAKVDVVTHKKERPR